MYGILEKILKKMSFFSTHISRDIKFSYFEILKYFHNYVCCTRFIRPYIDLDPNVFFSSNANLFPLVHGVKTQKKITRKCHVDRLAVNPK